jgi:cation transport regulator ChaB
MPIMGKGGKPDQDELPSTLQRSDAKAQRTFGEAHDAAAEEYGEGERAHRTAYAALKHSYEKVGDHWEAKARKGPSDAQAEGGVDTDKQTAGGVDANASKDHLYELAQRLDIEGRSRMDKAELVAAIKKASDRATSRAREKD